MDLILDIGNFRLKGAFFEGNRVVSQFVIPLDMHLLQETLQSHLFENNLIASVNPKAETEARKIFELLKIPFNLLDFSTLKVNLAVDEPEQLGHDRIANIYGSLFHFPQNDCIVVDLGTAVTFDYVSCNGSYLGGAIYPGVDISAKCLADYTELLPRVEIEKPPLAVAKTTKTHIQSGLYWGLLGAVERITYEMRASSQFPSDIKIIATGGFLRTHLEDFSQDLNDLVDLIDPTLTLIGLHEIMKEKKQNV